MTQMQINGGTQIKSGTITTTQLSSSAAITDGQLASVYLYANGSRSMTGALNMGSQQINSLSDPSLSTDAATKGYVDAVVQGVANKYNARAATNTETLTISSGRVTQITGTTVDGTSISVGDPVLIPNAPASTGAAGGTTLSTQPGNGLYICTNNTTNLTVVRAVNWGGTTGVGNVTGLTSEIITPVGSYVFVFTGTVWGNAGLVVSTPSTEAAFTYGSGNITFVQFNGLGDITVDSTLTKSGNQISRAAITGDVAISTGSNSSTIQSAAVTYAKFQNVAANSLVGNPTGGSATAQAVAFSATPGSSTVAEWDSNSNLSANNFVNGWTTTATAGTTTTMSVGNAGIQQWTGSTTQTVKLPTTSVVAGMMWIIINESTGSVTVQSSGANTIATLTQGEIGWFISNKATPTAATDWDSVVPGSGGGTVTSVSVVSANGLAGTVATATTTPAITISTSVTGVLKGNGTAISAAVAGTDYMAPSDFVTRETPSGTINGSNTTFTLANTPLSGTEQLFQNGLLLRAGASFDYTISTATITFSNAPISGDFLCASYQK
jgi:hypothetical protein